MIQELDLHIYLNTSNKIRVQDFLCEELSYTLTACPKTTCLQNKRSLKD